MGIISKLYIKNMVCRYDRGVGVPYYSYTDFEGLNQEEYTFTNSKGIELKYFYFYYDKFKKDKIVFFLHGLECGHAAYMGEINALAKQGYKVLTMDYTGCGDSKGKCLGSIYTPTKDVLELLDYLKIDKEIVLVGHSLGGFTALNLMNYKKEFTKAVILAGFIKPELEFNALIKSKFLVKGIIRYEKKVAKELYSLDNLEYLKNTNDKIFFIQSEDDGMIPYSTALKLVEEMNNPNIKTLKVVGRKHNPNYTDDAVMYMNNAFFDFNTKVKNKEIKTVDDRINFFKNIEIDKLVEQDTKMFEEIAKFIDK